ncbi:MAG: hypothetical protein AUJ74_00360 [Candidatus Omnitrophica bacterium CG1_02_44_16]|nr:MAG: hypothetical protein AUJ74_00360 [Candidatus Omnitrophica bacterium CG1_02_44_16]
MSYHKYNKTMQIAEIYYFYPIIVLLGVLTTFSDVRSHLIMNRYLFFAILAGICVYALQMFLGKGLIIGPYLFAANILFASATGFAFYWANLWGAGDGKLFATYAFLMPVDRYIAIFPFPCMPIFLSIFLLSMLAILIVTILRFFYYKDKSALLKGLHMNKIFKIFLTERMHISFVTPWLIWPFMDILKFKYDVYAKIIILFIFYGTVERFMDRFQEKRHIILSAVAIGIVARVIFQSNIFHISSFLAYFLRILKFTLFFYFLNILTQSELLKSRSHGIPKVSETGEIIPFAPFMMVGTLVANTDLVKIAIQFFSTIMR